MTVPEQVLQQMEQAQKLQSELYSPKEAPAPAENTPEAVAPAPETTPVEQTPAPTVAPEVTPTTAQDDFKHKYDVLNGKYTKEVPRLYEQLKERDAQLRELTARMEALEKQPEQTKEEPLVTSKDEEDFGADLVDMTRRTARQEVREALAAYAAELDKRFSAMMANLGEVRQTVVQTESDKFWARVTALVPDWDAVDNDPAWIEFLDGSPSYTTESYRDLAGKAIAAGKADAIASLVGLWRGAKPADPPPAPAKPNPELQRQVAPSTAKASAPAQTQKVWTAKEYEYVFSPQAMHEVSADKLSALQADAQQALGEGRIRW